VACDADLPGGAQTVWRGSVDMAILPMGVVPASIDLGNTSSPSIYGRPARTASRQGDDAPAISLAYGSSLDLYPELIDSAGTRYPFSPEWTTLGGTLIPTLGGLYRATHIGEDTVTAWTFDRIASGQVRIVVKPPPVTLVGLRIDPAEVSISLRTPVRLAAMLVDASGAEYPAIPRWSATGGSIGPDGTYTPQEPGQHTITAAYGDLTASASISVPEPLPARIEVNPAQVTLRPGQTQQFSAAGFDQNGEPVAISPAWSATGGTITPGGLFTAGEAGGAYTVQAVVDTITGAAGVTVAALETPQAPDATSPAGLPPDSPAPAEHPRRGLPAWLIGLGAAVVMVVAVVVARAARRHR
jgi:hypothetical protein